MSFEAFGLQFRVKARMVLVDGEIWRRCSSPSELMDTLKAGGLPADADIFSRCYNEPLDRIELVVLSDSFSAVPLDGDPPEFICRW